MSADCIPTRMIVRIVPDRLVPVEKAEAEERRSRFYLDGKGSKTPRDVQLSKLGDSEFRYYS